MNKRLFVLIVTLSTVCLAACAGAPQPGTPTAAALPSATPRPTTAINKLGLTGTPVEGDNVSYRLVVDGLVEHPLSLTYDQLLAYRQSIGLLQVVGVGNCLWGHIAKLAGNRINRIAGANSEGRRVVQ